MKKKVMALALAVMMAASLTAYAAPEDEDASGTEAASEDTSEGLGERIADEAMKGVVDLAIDEAAKAGDLEEDDSDSDLAYLNQKGTFIVGVTEYVPLDYKDENGNWIGFDADMAKQFAQQQGYDIQFVEIEWDKRADELNAKTIDCVWNGMSKSDEVASSMECTNSYMKNEQVLVVKADEINNYPDAASIANLSFAVENGSTAQAVLAGLGYAGVTPVDTQADAIKAVEDGTCEAAVVDSIIAAAMTGDGSAYADLGYTGSLYTEEFVVGFRKGSDMPSLVNQFLKYGCQYGIGNALIDLSQSDINN